MSSPNPQAEYSTVTTSETVVSVANVKSHRSIIVHMLSGTAPIFFSIGDHGATPVVPVVNADDLWVIHDGLRVREIPLAAVGLLSDTVKISFISAAAGTVYVEVAD